jgi:hypothetical protein
VESGTNRVAWLFHGVKYIQECALTQVTY